MAALGYAIFWLDLHTLLVLCVVAIQTLCIYCVKETFRVERPLLLGVGHSFPSASAANAVFLGCYYLWLLYRNRHLWSLRVLLFRATSILLYCILLVYTRLALQYNYVGDLVVGGLIGASITFIFVRFQLRYNEHQIVKWE